MNRLKQLIGDRAPIFDGGMGTLLQDHGLEAGVAGELWNVDNAEAIESFHRAYAEAGALFLTTNTFGGSKPRLDMHGLGDRVEEINQAAAAVARKVADETGTLVAGDLGPTGELLEPVGAMSVAEAQELFEQQLRGLVAGGIDVVLIETMSDLNEVAAAVAAAKAVAPDAPIVATLSFDTNLRTMMGVRPADAAAAAADLGVDAIGANCGRGPDEMEQIMTEMAGGLPADSDVLLAAQSNAGLPQVVGDHFEYTAGPDVMAEHAAVLRGLGVHLIGTCCGSTPAHTAAIREALANG